MPVIRYYTVTQEREVRVTAGNPIDAARIGAAAFANGQSTDNGVLDGPEGIFGDTTTPIKDRDIVAREDF